MQAPLFESDWPVTQPFGVNPDFYAQWHLAGHSGCDFGCPEATYVLLPVEADLVEKNFDPSGYGNYLKWRDGQGADWLFAHLSAFLGSVVGDHAIPGTPIALSGTTGASSGPHLHVGYRPYPPLRGWPFDGWVDPYPFLLRLGQRG